MLSRLKRWLYSTPPALADARLIRMFNAISSATPEVRDAFVEAIRDAEMDYKRRNWVEDKYDPPRGNC